MKVKVRLDGSCKKGILKPMNAVNNGPLFARKDQSRGNFESYAKAGFPYARTHDANLCYDYGAPHIVDITAVFPNFDADETDPASYDFTLTDRYISNLIQSGTKVFYRLGQSIEHWGKKYGIFPPKDNAKWARICEHIILHFNEGWANGYRYGIEYWEIWNEPDLNSDDPSKSPTWQGTKKQFFDLYETAAKYLKSRFPNLKIGGPAVAWFRDWAEDFLKEMQSRNVPIDFFSWHRYDKNPRRLGEICDIYREMLDRNGYSHAESILNEWNYVRDWGENWIYSLRAMQGIKGASYATAVMCVCQDKPLEMLMYYDARAFTGMNGLFDYLSLEPGKTYYPYLAFHQMSESGEEVQTESDADEVYALAVSNGKETQLLLTYFAEDDNSPAADLILQFHVACESQLSVYLTDQTRNMELMKTVTVPKGEQTMELPLNLFDIYHIVIASIDKE